MISIYLQYLHIYRSGYLGAWSPHTHGHPLVCSTWAVAASTLYLGQVVSVFLYYLYKISVISIMNIILYQADGTLQKHDVLEPTHSE